MVSCTFGPLSSFCRPSVQDRLVLAAAIPFSALVPPHSLSFGLETLQRFARLLWPVSLLYVVTVPSAAMASEGGFVLRMMLQLGSFSVFPFGLQDCRFYSFFGVGAPLFGMH